MSRHGVDDRVVWIHLIVKLLSLVGLGYLIGRVGCSVAVEVADELGYSTSPHRDGFA